MQLESPVTRVEKPADYVFNALCNVENYRKLMPENIAKFQVMSDDTFLFGLSGMPEIKLQITSTKPNSTVVLSAPDGKINFSLNAQIGEVGDNACDVQLLFNGEFNAMMAMMIKGPISKFLETLSANMRNL